MSHDWGCVCGGGGGVCMVAGGHVWWQRVCVSHDWGDMHGGRGHAWWQGGVCDGRVGGIHGGREAYMVGACVVAEGHAW